MARKSPWGKSSYMAPKAAGKSGGIMKDHGNTSKISTTEAQDYDMNRVRYMPYNDQGYPKKAFAYSW